MSDDQPAADPGEAGDPAGPDPAQPDPSQETVLVTGAGGFLGRGICRALLARGVTVRGLARGDYPQLRAEGVDMRRADLARGDPETLAAIDEAVAGCAAVFHVAALIEIWGPYQRFFATNVEGSRRLLQACRRHHVGKLIYTSTPSVVHGGDAVAGVDESAPYPDHFEAHYPATKAIAEREVLAANGPDLATVALRPHLVWGPDDSNFLPRLLAKARAGRVRMIGAPQTIDTTYIDNAVDAHLLAYQRLAPGTAPAGKAYFITNGEPMPGPQYIDDLLGAAGLPPVDKTISVTKARFAAAMIEGLWTLLGIQREPPLTRFMVSQLSTAHWYDISAAQRDLGYAPRVRYAEGMARLRAWLRAQGQ